MAENAETRDPVPYDRFQAVVSEKNTLMAEATSLRGEVQKLSEKAATADTLAGQVAEWKGKAEQASSRFTTFTELSGALGTTDTDVIETFDTKYRALPEAGRLARPAWIESLKAKPEEAAPVLRPWLAPAQAAGAPAPKPAPRPVGSGPTQPGAPAARDPQQERALREQCQASGNWGPWRDYTKSVGIRS